MNTYILVRHINKRGENKKGNFRFQFSCSVVSSSLWPCELQHARPPCPSPTPGVYSNLCPSSQWCPPAISSSVIPFSSCPQSLPASGSFPNRGLTTGRVIDWSRKTKNRCFILLCFLKVWDSLVADFRLGKSTPQ